MPNKKKIGKKSKLKRKMKGGWRGDHNDMPEDYPEPTPAQVNRAMAIQKRMENRAATEKSSVTPSAPPLEKVPMAKPGIPVAKATPIAKSKQGGSSYTKFDDDIYISMVMAVGFMGVIWFMISRTMIKHKYSEVLSYSLMGIGVILSLFLIIFKGVRQIKPSSSIIGAIKNMLFLAKYLAIRSVPGLLILLQIAVLCYIMYNHADYIFSSENIPRMFGIFNAITIVMILGQCWVWKDKVKEIMTNVTGPKNPMIIPGFILAAILSGIAISQLYIILEFLKTDC
tara:strand:- start:168 stop:1016 length:849 start_codon:yes stop_codon:yes gene_type:complete